MKFYCVKCRTKRSGKGEKSGKTKNKRSYFTAKCEKCGTKMFRFVKKK